MLRYPKNADSLRAIKKGMILKLALSGDKCSCAELGRRLDVSRATALHVIRELKQEGFLEESGLGAPAAKGGKRPLILNVCDRRNFIIGIWTRAGSVSAAVIDLRGRVIAGAEAGTVPGKNSADIICALAEKTRKNFQRSNPDAKILAAGISFPGRVDAAAGAALYAPEHGMRNFPLCRAVGDKTGLETFIENRVTVSGIAEKWFGKARGMRNFILLQMLPSLRASVFIDGRPHRGFNSMAGELGATPLRPENGEPRFLCDIIDSGVFGLPPMAVRLKQRRGSESGWMEEFQRKVAGFQYSSAHMKTVADCAKTALSHLLTFNDPESLLFDGIPEEFQDSFLSEMKGHLTGSLYMLPPESYKLGHASRLENRDAMGITGMCLERIFGEN
jgi:predicted NBD/HSP70 family sugar kinase